MRRRTRPCRSRYPSISARASSWVRSPFRPPCRPISRRHLDLKPGQPAMAADVLAAQGRLLNALRADGYPLAKVPTPVAILHPDQNLLDVDFQPDAGPKADIGPISFTGLKDMHESFVRKRLLLHQGEQYSPAAIEKARQDLMSIGVFSVVRVEPATALDASGQLPITFDFTERPLHAVDVGVGLLDRSGRQFQHRLARPQSVRQRGAAEPDGGGPVGRRCRDQARLFGGRAVPQARFHETRPDAGNRSECGRSKPAGVRPGRAAWRKSRSTAS